MTQTAATLAADILAEVLVRCGTESLMGLEDLCDIFAEVPVADIHAALLALRSARKVRLIALGCGEGHDMSRCILGDGGNEVYGAVKVRA